MDKLWLDTLDGLYVSNGQIVQITRCKPSRRKAASNTTKPRHQRVYTGALFAAIEAGKKLTREAPMN